MASILDKNVDILTQLGTNMDQIHIENFAILQGMCNTSNTGATEYFTNAQIYGIDVFTRVKNNLYGAIIHSRERKNVSFF